MKKILFLFWTHWDEVSLIEVMNFIDKKYLKCVDWLVVNEKAAKEKKRFLEFDINRIAPWDFKSDSYEIKRAAEIIKVAKKYDIVIDIHWTYSNSWIFILLPKATLWKLIISSLFDINKIVLWQSSLMKNGWPLTQFIRNWIEIEVWKMIEKESILKLAKILNNFLSNFLYWNFSYDYILKSLAEKQYYEVLYKILKDNEKFNNLTLKDFQVINIRWEKFYPILTNNPYGNIRCYLMKKVSLEDLILYNRRDRQVDLQTKVF